jgi:hypothetical protein
MASQPSTSELEAFALARYLRINTSTATAVEDAAFGADDFWYNYPAVMVDANNNLTMVINRSGPSEFPGIRYTGRLNSDPPGLQSSIQLKGGEGIYSFPNADEPQPIEKPEAHAKAQRRKGNAKNDLGEFFCVFSATLRLGVRFFVLFLHRFHFEDSTPDFQTS